MEIKKRNKSAKQDTNKRLEMKINEYKMLTNTLHEAFRKDDVTASTLKSIKRAIEDTLNDIALLREELENEEVYATYEKSSFFDKIKKDEGKKEDELPIKVLSGCKNKYDFENEYPKVERTKICDMPNPDNILFDNRFLCDLNVIGVPETMVKWVGVIPKPDAHLEVQIYDFVDGNGVPVLAKLSAYDRRKFTLEIKHLDPTGCVVYKEKYNGCFLDDEIWRGALNYESAEPSVITLKIRYDGVSYETGC